MTLEHLVVKRFVCYFHYVDWTCLSLGIHIDLKSPKLEIHILCGFIRIGWQRMFKVPSANEDDISWRTCGWTNKPYKSEKGKSKITLI